MQNEGDGEYIYNVTVPTIEPYLNATSPWGPSVVIAPGGGYTLLSIDKEVVACSSRGVAGYTRL